MIIRFDEQLRINATEEQSIIAGNNNVNEIKIFMYDGFDFSSNKAYLNFELSDGKQFNNISTTKEFKLNETGVDEEQCYYFVLPKYLLKQPGRFRLTVRISPLFEISDIENSSLITTQIYFAVFENGEEVIDPDTAELLRQDIANVEISTQASARAYVDQLANSGEFDGPQGETGAAATITVGEVKTVQPNQPAKVINIGDENNAILYFEIPKGETGEGGFSLKYTSSTGVIELLNKEGSSISSVDLPLELIVQEEGTGYNEETNMIELKLANGGVIYIPLTSLVSGLLPKGYNELNGSVDNPVNLYELPIGTYIIKANSYVKLNVNGNLFSGDKDYLIQIDHYSIDTPPTSYFIYGACYFDYYNSIGNVSNILPNGNVIGYDIEINGNNYSINEHDYAYNISLNSELERRPQFYAPIDSGVAGQILKSNGYQKAPTWVDDTGGATKTSELTNDGDGISPFATEKFVSENGGKIDSISVNGVEQTITNKNVNIIVPTDYVKPSELNAKQDQLTDAQLQAVNSGATSTNIAQITTNTSNITDLQNNKASVEFVNSSIATNTATFRGTYSDVEDLPTTGVDINDYAFVITIDANGNTAYNRYKFTTTWEYEYTLNNSSFTAEQWAAIQSGITSDLVAQITTNKNDIIGKANSSDIPTKTSQLTNDSGFITSAPVTSVNGQTGAVTIDSVDKDGSGNVITDTYVAQVTYSSVGSISGTANVKAKMMSFKNKNGTTLNTATIYEYNEVTAEKNGLMSYEDKNKLDGINLVTLTQAEYDALSTKDANTYYFIKEE